MHSNNSNNNNKTVKKRNFGISPFSDCILYCFIFVDLPLRIIMMVPLTLSLMIVKSYISWPAHFDVYATLGIGCSTPELNEQKNSGSNSVFSFCNIYLFWLKKKNACLYSNVVRKTGLNMYQMGSLNL